ncbi:integral membrane protein (TIGR01906 family) [Anaerosolibacter carboniphilus]|uniref:Integral membrane protein (TIGR01906 family) n=1 Tax=Anaerosolibacter carboniphilus TaxID=1417629 RepID=A0A841KRF9_9FIRM|nr:TIGR01906 family membrane protein [Anaerosolibacter carboniphilus]MBB6214660.1 integral membrane protein (TIGR01906 family) [Anaerosolibacter carboniphilus]
MKKENKGLIHMIRWGITLFLPLVILLTTLQVFVFDKDFYLKEFSKYEIPKVTGMSMADLERVAEKMIRYLKDEDKDLVIEGTVKGERREVFGEREKQHMVDVKNLFQGGYFLRNIGIFSIIAAILLLSRLAHRASTEIYKGIFHSSILTFMLMGLLLILMQIDFYKYFTYFHEIFFDNDLWLLDPNKEVLIQMLPLEFFIDIATRVVLWFVGIMIAMGGIAYVRLRKATY